MIIEQHTIETPYMVGPVHCYTATSKNGELILFDTGPPTERARDYLRKNLDLASLNYIFITHCHIDHYGLLSWLQEQTDVEVFIPYRDGLKILSHEDRLHEMYRLLAELGFTGGYLRDLHGALSDGRVFPPFPKKFNIVEDDMPPELGIGYYSCPGHSQSDTVFYSDSWAVTGDVLLRGVFQSPLLDVDLETGERFNNYAAYCSSIKKLAKLRTRQIYPAHRKEIDSVDDSITFYVSKMLGRAKQLQNFVDATNIFEVIHRLFGKSLEDPFHIYLKASEVVFMLDFLRKPELLQESLSSIGLFSKVAENYHRSLTFQGD